MGNIRTLKFGDIKIKLFNKLREVFNYDRAKFFLKNYFSFLDEMKYK